MKKNEYISIYWDKNWNDLQSKKENGEAIDYVFENNFGKIEYPFIKRKANKIDNVQYYDLVTARGQGGPRILCYNDKIQLIKSFEESFEKYCKKEKVVAEYIRFDPWIQNFEDFEAIYKIFSYGNIYCNDLEKDFFMQEYSSSVRRNVRKASKNNIIVKLDYDGETIKDFLNVYSFTEKKYNVSDYYYVDEEFIKKYFDILQGKVCIANAYYENKIISSVLLLWGKDIVHYHFAATDPKYSSLQGNTYLIYQVALNAQKKGIKFFDFGRAAERK